MAEAMTAASSEASLPGVLPELPRVLPGCELAGYEALHEENAYWVEPGDIRGQIPQDLCGTLFLTCVGRNKIGEQQFGHWFDGDGMINAVTLRDGRAHFRNRYVRTEKFLRESAAQRILYRGVGTQIPGGMLKNMFRAPGNAANTNVIYHGGKLLALWEGGKPFELDPANLHTVGEYDFDGALGKRQPFSAHPRLDPRTGCLYGFGVFGIPKPKLHFYRVDPDGTMAFNRSQYVGDYAMCHDFAITENHAVFVLCPAFMRHPLRFLFGLNSIMESIDFDPAEKTKVIVLRLDNGDIVREFEFDSFFGFHLGNAFEDGEAVNIDVLCVDDMLVMDSLSDVFIERGDDYDFLANGARYMRFTLDLHSGEARRDPVAGSVAGEFPSWHGACTGARHRYTWLGTIVENGTPYNFNAYQKIDHQTGELKLHDFGEGRFTSEANFVPRAGAAAEDDGYLVSVVYNHATGRSEVVIVDARDMAHEVAVIPLSTHIPFGFHGNFYPQTFV
ncbi:MAG: carotenoid oxygenase family protein [Halioglobus sp.]|nr:carotenoid oxygenase family protein [Halioglobus sp.]